MDKKILEFVTFAIGSVAERLHKEQEAFVLDLSFFGWEILSACTCGILGIFYVNPYVYATNTELFLELKNQYLWRQNQGK